MFPFRSVEDGRNGRGNTYDISLRDLADYYFVPLRACVQKGDVGAFMCSYNAINGTASCANAWLNAAVARRAWHWDGVIESDCGALAGIVAHGNAADAEGAAVAAVKATVDVECDDVYKSHLVAAEAKGKVCPVRSDGQEGGWRALANGSDGARAGRWSPRAYSGTFVHFPVLIVLREAGQSYFYMA